MSEAPSIATSQDILLSAIKALAADEIRTEALANVQITLAASGWRSAAILLTLAAEHIDTGDFLCAERSRQSAREQFITANDVFRQIREARRAAADVIGAEASQ